jgi:hypothetical protein
MAGRVVHVQARHACNSGLIGIRIDPVLNRTQARRGTNISHGDKTWIRGKGLGTGHRTMFVP